MGKLTAKQVIAYSKADPKKYSDGEGLYFCVRKQGAPYWMIRYTTAKGRREATLGQTAPYWTMYIKQLAAHRSSGQTDLTG
jgi:hypothetical protein